MTNKLNFELVDRTVINNYQLDRMVLLHRIIRRKNRLESYIHQLEISLLEEVVLFNEQVNREYVGA